MINDSKTVTAGTGFLWLANIPCMWILATRPVWYPFFMATEGLGILLCTWPVSFRMCSRWGSFAWLELVSTLQGGILHLTHWGRVTHIYVSKLAWPTPSHYLNQCWNFDNCTLGNKLQWNLNRNVYIFIQENAFENLVGKMAAILYRPQCVNF